MSSIEPSEASETPSDRSEVGANSPAVLGQTAQSHDRAGGPPWLYLVIVPVISALFSGLAAVYGAQSGAAKANEGAIAVQRQIMNEQRAREDRKTKEEVYLKFLDNADTYNTDTNKATSCLDGARKQARSTNSSESTAFLDCTAELNDLRSSRYAFQGSINEVYIYGSNEALLASQQVAYTLPASIGSSTIGGRGIPRIGQLLTERDQREFTRAYSDFLTVACNEVPARRRSNC